MSDQGFREIQLTGKQLVFLFMASVVVAVAIFLLGVSVGRGVRGTPPASADAAPEATLPDAPPAIPPPTALTAEDLSYHDQLQGQDTPAARSSSPERPQAAPASPPASTSAASAPAAAPPPTGAAREAASRQPPPPGRSPAPPPATAPPPAPAGVYVQAGAFGARANANTRVAELKAKGHAATVVVEMTAPAYRVRLGPFPNRQEADRFAARLRAEGFDSSVLR